MAMHQTNGTETDGVFDVLHWYDLTCPFCYVGQQRTSILVRRGLTVTELPFQAHPDVPPGGMGVGVRVGPTYDMIRREADAAGLPLRWTPRIPNSRLALAAAEWVRNSDPSRFRAFQEGLFAAHFALGQDIGDLGVIKAHAASAGVDSTGLEAALQDGAAEALVRQSEAQARREGVRGTPAWLIGDRMISGLATPAEFEREAAN